MNPKPRAAVERMVPYKPPSEGRAGKLRLDFNENTAGASPKVVEAIQRALTAESLTLYPEYSEVRPKLARHFGVNEDEMLLTNGTDEAIQVLVNTFVEEGDAVYVPHPSYAMYRFYAELAGARTTGRLDGAKLACLANPNNPTGEWMERGECLELLEHNPSILFLIDEAYFEFSRITVLDCIGRYPNLFVSRTFSKAYGMAGMRMGCLFSQAPNAAWMYKAQSPYSVNALAILAASAAIDDPGAVDGYIGEVLGAREDAYNQFAQMKIAARPSKGNFILFDAGDRAIEIRDALREKGVLVRDRSYEAAGCVRLTIGTRAQVSRFFEELRKIW